MSNVSINLDAKHILSATADEVILRGEDKKGDCILRVSKETYFAVIDEWLNEKSDYSERWGGEYCGVGNVLFDGVLSKKHKAYLTDQTTGKSANAKVYTAADFTVEMEHG